MVDCNELKQAMADEDEDKVIEIVNAYMAENGQTGEGSDEVLAALQDGMTEVGDLFDKGEYFVGDLMFAGEIMTESMGILKPAIAKGAGDSQTSGKLIFCTVKNDLHDIGKNIVKAMMEAGGLEVIDLGVDAEPQTIIDEIKKNDVHVLALSGVLTLAIDSMKDTVNALAAAGIRDDVKVLIGGAPVTAEYCRFTGADDWSLNPAHSVDICRNWFAELSNNAAA